MARLMWVSAIAALALPVVAQGRLGGGGTVDDASANAFSLPSPLLDAHERRGFAVGNSFFKQNWVTAPASTANRDGLGPLFNARSCSGCHFKDGRSRPPQAGEVERQGLLVRIGVRQPDGPDLPHPRYGGQLQDCGVHGVAPEVRIELAWRRTMGSYGDGAAFELVEPVLQLREPAYGPLGGDGELALGGRVAPQLIGLGLLEAIPRTAIEALADADDRDGDGISGRVHVLADGRLGRFGWKATQADVPGQTAAAFVNDIGITSALAPDEALTGCERQQLGGSVRDGAPEIDAAAFARVVLYTRALAVPAQRDVAVPAVQRGRALFAQYGCAVCHVPAFTTAAVDWHPGFGGQRIEPYTDLLLHDLGEGLADGKRDGDAAPAEWRTPPLWGIGLVPTVNGHSRYLHDGRARDLAEAVLWHGGEALRSREAFRTAAAADRAALLAFLGSL